MITVLVVDDSAVVRRLIVDAHHHMGDKPGIRYLFPDLLADMNSGHDVRATVFIEWRSMYRRSGSAEMRPVGEVEHGFTHFTLTLRLLKAEGEAEGMIWTPRSGLDALPSVFLKAARAGLSNLL